MLGFRARLFRARPAAVAGATTTRGARPTPTYRIQYDAPAIQYVAVDGVIPFVTAAGHAAWRWSS